MLLYHQHPHQENKAFHNLLDSCNKYDFGLLMGQQAMQVLTPPYEKFL
jgi:hypothetical protein